MAYLEGEAHRLCEEASGTIPRVVDHLLLESAHAASIALYLSLQCRIDYLCQTHLPSLTKALVQRVDEALQAAYSKVLGYDVLDPFGVPRPDGTRPLKDPGFIRARARLKTKHGGIGFRPHDERYPFLNALHTTIPSMAGGPHPLWEELAGVLGKGDAFNPEAKHRRWTHFFGSGSTFAAELRSEIQRAKDTFTATRTAAGVEPTPHHIFDAEVDAFGVSTEAGVGDIQKLHKSMMDAIRGLQSEDVAARARRLDLDDPRRTPACQAGLSKTANTLFNNAPTQRKRFKTREEFQTAALRSRGAPLRALQGSYRKDIKPPGQAATDPVDAEGNNLYMAKLKATNLKARGLRSHNIIVDWLSHWLHAAGIRHRGGYKGRPGSCKGLFSDACSRVVVERKWDATTGRWAESVKAFEARRARLLNGIIADLCLDLHGTELKAPTKRLQALLDGRSHLVDVKTLLPGKHYQKRAATTASRANERQAKVNSEYVKHAQDCDAAVPGPDTPFQTRLNEFGTEGRVLAPVVGTWCETSDDFDLLIELIAHALADKETSMLRVAHDQAVARQRQKLTADFGVAMHIAWTRHLLDNREFIVGGGTQPNTEPSRGEGLDGSATAEERDNYHRDAYENARNHASGPPAARG